MTARKRQPLHTHMYVQNEWRKAIKKSEMKLQLSLNDYIGREKKLYIFIYFFLLYLFCMHFGCMLNAHFSPSLFEFFFAFKSRDAFSANTNAINGTFIVLYFQAHFIYFLLFFWNRPHAYTFSCVFSICPTLSWLHAHTLLQIDSYTMIQNELYLKAKWMLYYDAGSGMLPSLLLDFFSAVH